MRKTPEGTTIEGVTYHYIEHRAKNPVGHKWVIIRKSNGEVLSTHSTDRMAMKAFRAMMRSVRSREEK